MRERNCREKRKRRKRNEGKNGASFYWKGYLIYTTTNTERW